MKAKVDKILSQVRFGWLALTACLVVVTSSYGQEGSTFRVLGYGDGLFEGIYFDSIDAEGEAIATELKFLPDKRSVRYTITEEEEALSFYLQVEGENDALVKREVARVRLDSSMKMATLVFVQQEEVEGEESYQLFVLDDSQDVWGGGKVRFLNLTGTTLQCDWGGRRLELEDGPSEVFSAKQETRLSSSFSLSVAWQNEQRVVYSSNLTIDKNYGKTLVIKPPEKLGSLRVRVVTVW